MNRILCLGVFVGWLASPSDAETTRSIRLVFPDQPSAVVKNLGQVFTRQVERRCDAQVTTEITSPLTVELAIAPGLGNEGYRITEDQAGTIRILGNDERGLLYGIGKFLRTSQYDGHGFTPGTWRGTSAPRCPMRIVYLATHFNNWYESAPVADVVAYIQDLGLWGYNTIDVGYPFSQFESFEDPASVIWLQRYREILAKTKLCGLRVSIGALPNGGFKNVRADLMATPVPGAIRGNNFAESHYCASKPEARRIVLDNIGRLMDELKDVGLDGFVFWPYDEGGCGCDDCWPWGSRGFLDMSKTLRPVVLSRFPECDIILCTWCFENENDANPDGEWIGLAKAMEKDKSWVDYIMADGHEDYFPQYLLEHGVPGDLSLLNFPEISMFGRGPWGGFGANPAPAHFQQLWDRIKHMAAGGMPYSEGIYEDMNKAIVAGFYWNPECKAEDTLREYIAFEFSPDVVEELITAIRILERTLYQSPTMSADAVHAFEIIDRANAKLTDRARSSWRWRFVHLRALIDKEMYERQGKLEGETLKRAFAEIMQLSRSEGAYQWLRPPTVD